MEQPPLSRSFGGRQRRHGGNAAAIADRESWVGRRPHPRAVVQGGGAGRAARPRPRSPHLPSKPSWRIIATAHRTLSEPPPVTRRVPWQPIGSLAQGRPRRAAAGRRSRPGGLAAARVSATGESSSLNLTGPPHHRWNATRDASGERPGPRRPALAVREGWEALGYGPAARSRRRRPVAAAGARGFHPTQLSRAAID